MGTHDSDRVFERRTPDKGQTTLSDDSETTVFDIGANNGGTAFQAHSILMDITLGSHANITVAVKVDINGSLKEIASNQYSSAATTDVFGDINPDNVTSEHVQVTVEGSNASPSTNGTVDRSIEYSRAD